MANSTNTCVPIFSTLYCENNYVSSLNYTRLAVGILNLIFSVLIIPLFFYQRKRHGRFNDVMKLTISCPLITIPIGLFSIISPYNQTASSFFRTAAGFFSLVATYFFIIIFLSLAEGMKNDKELPVYLQTRKKILISVGFCYTLHLFLFISFAIINSTSGANWESFSLFLLISFGLIDLSFIVIIVLIVQIVLVCLKGLNESIALRTEGGTKGNNNSNNQSSSNNSGRRRKKSLPKMNLSPKVVKERLLKVTFAGVNTFVFSILVYTTHMITTSILEQDGKSGMIYWIIMDTMFFGSVPFILSYLLFGFYAKIRRNLLGESDGTEESSGGTKATGESTGDTILSRSSNLTSSNNSYGY